jgi:hypothetical protein
VRKISVKVLTSSIIAYFGFIGTTLGQPLDSPGTVYIDGSPCNLLCQDYLEWSRQTLEPDNASQKGEANNLIAREGSSALSTGIAKRESVRPTQKKRDVTHVADRAPAKSPHALTSETESSSGIGTRKSLSRAAAEPVPVAKSQLGSARLNDDFKEKSAYKAILAALIVADQSMDAASSKALGSDRANKTGVRAEEASPGPLVALILSRLSSTSALAGQDIAISDAEFMIEQDILAALAATGAAEAHVSVGKASPLDRLMRGDVQAALLKVVLRDGAEAFPDIEGFTVLRLPLFAD